MDLKERRQHQSFVEAPSIAHKNIDTENMPPASDSNHYQHYKDQLDILHHAINLTSQLASIDYSSTDTATSDTKAQIQTELDQMQKKWRLEDTALPAIIASIHRFQSNIGHLQTESTDLTSQIQSSGKTIQTTQKENAKLKRTCIKLFRENKKLSKKLKKKSMQGRQFVNTVREFLLKKKQEELDTEEFLVACHESMMKKSCGYSNSGLNVNVDGSTTIEIRNRQRTYTAESTFSDLDGYSCSSMMDEACAGEDDSDETASRSRSFHVDTGTLGEYGCDNSYVSQSPANSTRSYVTDESPSIRFMPRNNSDDTIDTSTSDDKFDTDGTCPIDKSSLSQLQSQSKPKTSHKNVSYKTQSTSYTLSFLCSKEIGMQFVEVPSNMNIHTHSASISATSSGISSNRRRAFSDGAALNLGIVNESEESVGTSIDDRCGIPLSPGRTSKKSSFSMDKLFGTKSKRLNTDDDAAKSTNTDSDAVSDPMILVRDLEGFDTSQNVRPTIGARLIAINDQCLTGAEWTLDKTLQYLQEQRKNGEMTKLTFRNEPLSKSQKKLLEARDERKRTIQEKEDKSLKDSGQQLISVSSSSTKSSFLTKKTVSAKMANTEKSAMSSFFKFGKKSDEQVPKESVFAFMKNPSEKNEKDCSDATEKIAKSQLDNLNLDESLCKTRSKRSPESDSKSKETDMKDVYCSGNPNGGEKKQSFFDKISMKKGKESDVEKTVSPLAFSTNAVSFF